MVEIFFITSNPSKLEHAKFLCKDYNVQIIKQKQYGIGYDEPKIKDREKLLETSINDAVKRLSKVIANLDDKFILIEDTSVIIDALSSHLEEVPGVDVKYWMREITFEKLNFDLKENGNNREVIVRSDLILFLPKVLQEKFKLPYKHFVSSSHGVVTDKEYEITTQPLYPWLSSKTFNKWFIPDDRKLPMSLLEISEADQSDFRKGAFLQMLQFLKANGLVKHKNKAVYYKQMNLFSLSLFVVCGRSCSGKTTISDYLTKRYGFYHIEASDFMYLSFYEKHGPTSEVKIGDFATEALKENPTIVVDQIILHLGKLKNGESVPVVISGFRDPQEIEGFKKKYNGELDITVVFIEASLEIRFQRCIERGRSDSAITMVDFIKRDKQQVDMGLEIIKIKINSENIIVNESTLDSYYKNFETHFEDNLNFLPKKRDIFKNIEFTTSNSPKKLEHAILIALADKRNEFLTTTQIAHLINLKFRYIKKKEKDNISRYFNHNYHPYYEIKVDDGKLKYRLSQTGFSLSQLLLQGNITNLNVRNTS